MGAERGSGRETRLDRRVVAEKSARSAITTRPEGRVKATLHAPGYARFTPFNLPRERFAEYRAAVDGARYVRELHMRLTPVDKVPAILVRLRKAGFHVDAAPDLRRLLQERDARDWLDSEALKERISRIDDELWKQSGNRMHPHQRTGAFWLAHMSGALLADEMGTGKTLEILVAIPAKAPVLVVAPAVAKGDWRGQLRQWRPQMKYEVLKGRRSFRWPKPGETLITNYDILPDIHDGDGVTGRVCKGLLPPKPCPGCDERIAFSGSLVTKIRTGHLPACSGFLPGQICPGCHPLLKLAPHGTILVGDEAHNLKNGRSLRSMRFSALSEAVRNGEGRVWLASGTPLENEPPELWNVLKAAGIAEVAFGNWDQFKVSFKGKKVLYGHEWGLPGDDVKERLQRVMLRRLKKDVLPDLPTKTWSNYEVDLDPKALRSIDEFLRTSKRSIAEIVALVEKQEIGFEFMSSVRAAIASAKIPAMLEIVKDFEERDVPLVVFSAHRAPIDVLTNRPGWVVVTGDLDGDQKTRAADQFQNGYYIDPKAVLGQASAPGRLSLVGGASGGKLVKGILRRVDARGEVLYPKGIAITIASGGVSLTLTRACNELFVDRAWKPTANQQAEDRCVRIGQTAGTVVKTIVANHPLDARVTEVLVRKTMLISLSIDAAADGAHAPLLTEKDLVAYRHEVQEAIACGRAVRRIAKTSQEKEILEELHTLDFRNRSDERLAGELAEEALAIGLSDAQWELALRIVDRGRQEKKLEEEKRLALTACDDTSAAAVDVDEDEAEDEAEEVEAQEEAQGMPRSAPPPDGQVPQVRRARWGRRRS